MFQDIAPIVIHPSLHRHHQHQLHTFAELSIHTIPTISVKYQTIMSKPSFADSAVRKAEDIAQAKPQFSREIREKASTKEKLIISSEATKGAESKLQKVDVVTELSQKGRKSVLNNNVEVDTFIENLERHCVRFDMNYFMTNFPSLEEASAGDHDRFRSGKTVDLFKKWDLIGSKHSNKQVVLNNIGETIAWLKTYTKAESESYLEDMEWVHMHLLNSMTPELREDVLTTLKHDFPKEQHGGPLTFAVMIDKVINLSPSAIDTMKANLKTYNIKDIPGEDVSMVVRQFLYALKRLESNGAIDTLLIQSLYKVFQTTSVPEFNDQMAHMARGSIGINAVQHTYKQILDAAKDHYKYLISLELWTGVTPVEQESAFQASQETKIPPINPPPTESPYCLPTEADRVSSNPDRFERSIKGRLLKFCAKCPRHKGSKKLGRWNSTHFSDEHHGGKKSQLQGKESSSSTSATSGTTKTVSMKSALLGAQAGGDGDDN